MTPDSFDSLAADPEDRFDRLVDGSLNPSEYRALLASFDNDPGAWRQCALSFLEAQALQQELRALQNTNDPQTLKSQAPHGNTTSAKVLSQWLAIAASFLAALAIGIYAPTFFASASNLLRRAKEPLPTGNLPMQAIVADHTSKAGESLPRRVGDLQLIVDSDEQMPFRGQVPVFEIQENLDEILAREEAALSPELVDVFRRFGYEVRHEQQFVPAPLDDGRQVIVPVQGYEIRPVSRTY